MTDCIHCCLYQPITVAISWFAHLVLAEKAELPRAQTPHNRRLRTGQQLLRGVQVCVLPPAAVSNVSAVWEGAEPQLGSPLV